MTTSNATVKKQLGTVPLSVLDLAPVVIGATAADALRNSLDLAQHTEKWGFNRYWLAEHHNMPGIASSATAVVIGHIAGGTSTIRVGSGGIMLPNHSPLVIAEQFGTLESLYPGRIDLGLGRAPGSDRLTAMALRRDLSHGENFSDQLDELFHYFSEAAPGQQVRAVPGEGLNIPIWLLGSSDFSARLAGQLGLPFAFASHFSPDYTLPALHAYHSSFVPSPFLDKPYTMVGVNAIAADTDERAAYLASSMQQQFLNIIRGGAPSQIKPPVDMETVWSEYEKAAVQKTLRSSITGSPDTFRVKMNKFIAKTQADEVIINSTVFDHQERLRSYEIIGQMAKGS
ncbi:LLM class flavin-dependent oxidoreductase [Paenibacillus sp. NEAU-GSW1]|uniref:LLM class flavin-dependent oxidoreductase n=1 Tax=Paenibacillus sp. NEAU-GSW1 TaxID=2682486 RepID=UPI0012E308BF|nr:LLM class flavin-dependent oxidoreductase [Paenibacillus sp. NEAU-GSW1]MUT66927.1 MsnO8 family LLM class oxidoreductase [Paenibacillus sp. NEAU-GSW1]